MAIWPIFNNKIAQLYLDEGELLKCNYANHVCHSSTCMLLFQISWDIIVVAVVVVVVVAVLVAYAVVAITLVGVLNQNVSTTSECLLQIKL